MSAHPFPSNPGRDEAMIFAPPRMLEIDQDSDIMSGRKQRRGQEQIINLMRAPRATGPRGRPRISVHRVGSVKRGFTEPGMKLSSIIILLLGPRSISNPRRRNRASASIRINKPKRDITPPRELSDFGPDGLSISSLAF
eukprot:2208791-Pyramimonas_sp.AAC.1